MILDTEARAAVDYFRQTITPVRMESAEWLSDIDKLRSHMSQSLGVPHNMLLANGNQFGKSMLQTLQEQAMQSALKARYASPTFTLNPAQYSQLMEVSNVRTPADRSHKRGAK